jgi:lysozyme
MRLSQKGLGLVKSFEGCLQPVGGGIFVPYICPAGVLTIGWGHTNDGGRPFDKSASWSQAECDKALADDMVRYERAVERLVKVSLTQGQFDALVSFCYNCGEGNLGKSTLLRCVNARDFEGAARQFAAWNKGGGKVLRGLTRRRAAEAELFRSDSHPPVFQTTLMSEPMAQRVDAPDDEPDAPEPTAVVPVNASPADQEQQIQDSAERDAEPSSSWLKRHWGKLTSTVTGMFGMGGAALFDWRIVAVLIGSVFVLMIFIIFFMGPGNVRAWVRKQVS